MIDHSLLPEFISETREHIDLIEPDLVNLEKDQQNKDLINNIFAAFHSIKGSSGYLGLTPIYNLTHAVEELLSPIRKDQKQFSRAMYDAIFAGIDQIKAILKEYEEQGASSISTDRLVQQFTLLREQPATPPARSRETAVKKEQALNLPVESREHATSLLQEFTGLAADSIQALLKKIGQSIRSKKLSKKNLDEIADWFNHLLIIAEYQGFDAIWQELKKFQQDLLVICQNHPDREKLTVWLEALQRWIGGSGEAGAGSDSSLTLSKAEERAVFDDYDHSLTQIFIESLQSNLIKLEMLLPDLENESGRVQYLTELEKIHQSAKYMDIDWVVDLVTEQKLLVTNKTVFSSQDTNQLQRGISRLNLIVEKWFAQKTEKATEKNLPEIKAVSPDYVEEDLELQRIFIENYIDYLEQFRRIADDLQRGEAQDGLVETLRDLTEQINSSANYMNYDSILHHLADVENLLDNVGSGADLLTPQAQEILIRFMRELCDDLKTVPGTEGFDFNPYLNLAVIAKVTETVPKATAAEDFDLSLIFKDFPVEKNSKDTILSDTGLDQKQQSIEPQSFVITETPVPKTDLSPLHQKTLRVDVGKIEDLMSMVGELVVNRSMIDQLSLDLRSMYSFYKSLENRNPAAEHYLKDFVMKMDSTANQLIRITNQLQEGVMRIRMLPVSSLFNRFPRMVREISQEAGKETELIMAGEETELDKSVIEKIYDPLVHLIRNAIDHGLESAAERREAGKPEAGKLSIRAYHESGKINIVVEDDGRGIDKEKVIRKAVELNLLNPEYKNIMKESEIYGLLFQAGFSTVEKVSNLSGRGVGLDVVKRNIERLSGQILVTSQPGSGTRFTIQIPLTLAIIQALLVKVQNNHLAIPLSAVIEAIKVKPERLDSIEGHPVFYYRSKIISVLDLGELFNEKPVSSSTDVFMVVVSSGTDEIGLLVNRLVGQQDIVIKSFEEEVVAVEGISGAAILGGGDIALIVDVPSLISSVLEQEKRIRRLINVTPAPGDE
jgi:two-component system chemotaxis sensor kinase CheA